MERNSNSRFPHPAPKLHVAILLDGNGRWAASRGLRALGGHRAGVAAVRRVVRAAPALGIGTLTLYAFSANNWERPAGEVASLLGLLEDYLRSEAAECAAKGIRLRVIGRRDRIPPSLVEAIEIAERVTAAGPRARSAHRARLLVARSDSARCLLDDFEPRSLRQGIRAAPRPGDACGRLRAGRRSADSHRRRAPPERFHALGMRLRGTVFHAADVAGIRGRRSCGGRRRIFSAASAASAACPKPLRANCLSVPLTFRVPHPRFVRVGPLASTCDPTLPQPCSRCSRAMSKAFRITRVAVSVSA